MNEHCNHCGRITPCAHYPESVEGFAARVELAARCIRSGDGLFSRAFDNCFEMWDGAAVVALLDRMASRDLVLRAGMARVWDNEESQAAFARTVASLAHVAEHRLPEVARSIRAAREAESEARHAGHGAQLALI